MTMTEITVQDEPIVRNFLYTVQVKFHNPRVLNWEYARVIP